MSINSVNISGNLAADAVLRSTQGGTAILDFRLAVNERVKQQDGSYADRPNWVGCVLFGTRAEKLAQYMTKGKKVAVSGRLRYSEWEKDGQKRSKLEVIANDIEFMTSAQQQGQQAPYQQPPASPEMRQAAGAINAAFPGSRQVPAQAPDLAEEDLPF